MPEPSSDKIRARHERAAPAGDDQRVDRRIRDRLLSRVQQAGANARVDRIDRRTIDESDGDVAAPFERNAQPRSWNFCRAASSAASSAGLNSALIRASCSAMRAFTLRSLVSRLASGKAPAGADQRSTACG